MQPVFLLLVGMLGTACSLVYPRSRSVWPGALPLALLMVLGVLVGKCKFPVALAGFEESRRARNELFKATGG